MAIPIIRAQTRLIKLSIVSTGEDCPRRVIRACHVGFFDPALDERMSKKQSGRPYIERIKAHEIVSDVDIAGNVLIGCQGSEDTRCNNDLPVISKMAGESIPLGWVRFLLERMQPAKEEDAEVEYGNYYRLMVVPGGQQVLVGLGEINYSEGVWDMINYSDRNYADRLAVLLSVVQ